MKTTIEHSDGTVTIIRPGQEIREHGRTSLRDRLLYLWCRYWHGMRGDHGFTGGSYYRSYSSDRYFCLRCGREYYTETVEYRLNERSPWVKSHVMWLNYRWPKGGSGNTGVTG